jgi:hypothetical protein
MGTGFLQLMGIHFFALPGRIMLDVAPPPTDVAPPPTLYLGLGLGVLAALCGLVVVIAVVAFFVIRAVKKNNAAKATPLSAPNIPPAQNP